MALKRNKLEKDLGLSLESKQTGRVVRQDGEFNVRYHGDRELNHYQNLVSVSWLKFFVFCTSMLVGINLMFATIFYTIGVEHFSGIHTLVPAEQYYYFLYFSFQTFSTVGYGGIAPVGHLANIFATLDSLVGILFVAITTALFFARFSRPQASFRISKKVLLSPYRNNSKALMFRVVNNRRHAMSEVSIRIASRFEKKTPQGTYQSVFAELKLERSEIMFFPYNWTIVHEIDKDSPFYHFSAQDWQRPFELLGIMKGFDDVYGQVVQQRISFTEENFEYGKKFTKMYSRAADGVMDVYMEDLDTFEDAQILN